MGKIHRQYYSLLKRLQKHNGIIVTQDPSKAGFRVSMRYINAVVDEENIRFKQHDAIDRFTIPINRIVSLEGTTEGIYISVEGGDVFYCYELGGPVFNFKKNKNMRAVEFDFIRDLFQTGCRITVIYRDEHFFVHQHFGLWTLHDCGEDETVDNGAYSIKFFDSINAKEQGTPSLKFDTFGYDCYTVEETETSASVIIPLFEQPFAKLMLVFYTSPSYNYDSAEFQAYIAQLDAQNEDD